MSVQTNGEPGQAPATGTPQPGQAPDATQGQQNGQPGQTGQDPNGQPSQFDPSTIQDPALKAYLETQAAELTRARQEAAANRVSARTATEQAQQLRQQHETDAERQQREQQERDARLTQLEQENRELKIGGAVTAAATTAKAHDPALVAQLVQGDLEFGTDGKPTNVDAVVAKLKAARPYLFQTGAAGADAGAGGSRQASPRAGVGDSVNAALRGARSASRVTTTRS